MPKINTNQAKRLVFLMRSSVSVLTGSYVKKSNDLQPITAQAQPEPRADTEQEIKETKRPRDRREYLKAYYELNKEKLIESIKATDKKNYHTRFIRELNEGVIAWEKVRSSTRLKYKLSYDVNKKIYISDL
jgi:hypothetical protein